MCVCVCVCACVCVRVETKITREDRNARNGGYSLGKGARGLRADLRVRQSVAIISDKKIDDTKGSCKTLFSP